MFSFGFARPTVDTSGKSPDAAETGYSMTNSTGQASEHPLDDSIRPEGASAAEHLARDRRFLLCAGAIFLVFMSWQYVARVLDRPSQLPWKPGADSQPLQVNINTDSWVELSQLEGIGPALAHRIVDWRQANGKFDSVDDLSQVSGIGPAIIEKLRPFACVEGQSADRN